MERFVTSFEEIGRAKGREEGRAEGRAEGLAESRREVVLRQLARKVGPLAPEHEARVSALPPEELLNLGEALLDFTAEADLTAWLERQPGATEA